MSKKVKRHQIKSRWYYIFWSIMAAAVVGSSLTLTYKYDRLLSAVESLTYAIENEVIKGTVSVPDRGGKLGPGY